LTIAVAVDHVRFQIVFTQEAQGVVCEPVEAVPELFLGDVAFLAAVDADNAGLVAKALLIARIIGTDRAIQNPPGQQVNPRHIVAFPQRTRQFHHIATLAAGVGISSQFQAASPYQPMHADENDMQPFPPGRIFLLRRCHKLAGEYVNIFPH